MDLKSKKSPMTKPTKRIISNWKSREKQNSIIAEAKLIRLLEMISYIKVPRNIPDIAKKLNATPRTAYRYLHLLEGFGICIDKDLRDRYFIAQDNCPVCGSNNLKKLHVKSLR